MIAARKREYILDEKVDIAFSRLKWVVEQDNLWYYLVFVRSANTNRKWIGKLNEEEYTFSIMLSSRIFWFKWLQSFGQVYIKGKLSQVGTKTQLVVRFCLGPSTIAMFLLIGFFLYSIVINDFTEISLEKFLSIIPLLIFLILSILPLLYSLNKNEDQIADLMD